MPVVPSIYSTPAGVPSPATATAGTVPVGTVIQLDALPGADGHRPSDEAILLKPPGADEWTEVGTVGRTRSRGEPKFRVTRPGTWKLTYETNGDLADIKASRPSGAPTSDSSGQSGGLTADQQTGDASASTDTTTSEPTGGMPERGAVAALALVALAYYATNR